MSGATDFSGRDFDAFTALSDSFNPVGLGAGYLGVFEEGAVIDPAPAPSGSPDAPTIYARWAYDKDEASAREAGAPTGRAVLRTFDPESAPVRFWVYRLAARIEPGSAARILGSGGLFEQFRAHAAAASRPGFQITPEDTEERHGRHAGWQLYVLPVNVVASD